MLKTRLITALVLAPIVVIATIVLPTTWYAVAWGVVFAIAAWEWSDLCGMSKPAARLGLVLAIIAAMTLAPLWANWALDWISWPVVAWWFVLSLLIRRAPNKLLKLNYPLGVKLAIGFLVLITSWIHLVWLHWNFHAMQVLYLLLLIWLADGSAYFVGKNWGFAKLAPEISPGKTVEGMYGSLFASALFALTVGLFKQFDLIMIVDFVLISLLTVVVSVVGDLFESLIKRIRGVKDSGALLPGHGGILDRIDSILAAAPLFYLGSYMRDIFL